MTEPGNRRHREEPPTNITEGDTDTEVNLDPDEALTQPTEEFDADDVPDPDVAEVAPGDDSFVEPGVETPVEPTP